jgi:hypothetical protein
VSERSRCWCQADLSRSGREAIEFLSRQNNDDRPTRSKQFRIVRDTIDRYRPMETFYISPLIRITLSLLYLSLTIPLPFLAVATGAGIPAWLLWLGIGTGFVALQGALAQRVEIDDRSVRVNYPGWVPAFFTKSWQLEWAEIKDLKLRTTGQGGLVYYLVNQSGEGFLLPMRVAGFARLLELVNKYGSIDTQDIRPLAQPWMYFTLLALTLFLLLVDGWTISTAIELNS